MLVYRSFGCVGGMEPRPPIGRPRLAFFATGGMQLASISMDRVSPEKRSEIMRLVKGKNTKPELLVRRLLHALGYRYRLHVATLPGCPDIVFPKLKKIIFVNGCFWHQHCNCRKSTMPKSRTDFWMQKLLRNVERDKETSAALSMLGWQQMVIWQCELKDPEVLAERIILFLGRRAGEKRVAT